MTTRPHPSQLYLWDKRTLYIGPLYEAIELSQGAATLTVALNGLIQFKTPKMSKAITCSSLLLPPSLKVSVDTQDTIIANCNLDPLLQDWSALDEKMQQHEDKIGFDILDFSSYQSAFLHMYEEELEADSAYPTLMKLLELAEQKRTKPYKVDTRISCVIETIKNNVESNLTIEFLAESVNLSVPRLVQLFKQQTGVPIRRYRLWHRLFVTSLKMGEGYNLTDASIAAGFADGAHFANTFRSMLGMKPSMILAQPNQIRINLPQSY